MDKEKVAQRLLAKSERVGECLIWQGTIAGSNAHYGQISYLGKKTYVHRLAYQAWVGDIPEGLEIDHVARRGCRSKLCIEPGHLEPVDHGENRRRGRLKTCRSGKHDLTDPNNMRWDNAGQRRGCRPCHSDRQKERRLAAQKAG